MTALFRNAALAAALLASSATYAVAQSGPVDGKGQAGATAHRMIDPSSTVARGDYSAAGEPAMTSDSYRSAELRGGRSDGYETRSVSGPRYGSYDETRSGPAMETSRGPDWR